MRPAPVPGEAKLEPGRRTLAVVQNVTLGVMTGEQRIDAVYDTGATYCVVPRRTARRLGFTEENRLRSVSTSVVGGDERMDLHTMEFVKAGTAMAYRVDFLVGEIKHLNRPVMLLGLSFMRNFTTTTLDLEGGRVLFR